MITDGDERFVAICFWSSGDRRREGGAFSSPVKVCCRCSIFYGALRGFRARWNPDTNAAGMP